VALLMMVVVVLVVVLEAVAVAMLYNGPFPMPYQLHGTLFQRRCSKFLTPKLLNVT